MSNFFGDDDLYEVYNIFTFIITVISAILSLLTIWLIQRMNVRSGHLLLLLWMSYFQLIYDAFCFTANSSMGYYTNVISSIFRMSSFTTSIVISNWMSYIAFRVVFYKTLFDAYEHFYTIIFTSMIPGCGAAIFYGAVTIPQSSRMDDYAEIDIVYASANGRVFFIFVNFVFSCAIMYKIIRISSKSKILSPQDSAIKTIAVRMIFYPLVQMIGRIGHLWYDFAYDGNHNVQDNMDTTKFSCLMFTTITTFTISVGYFLIPLIMQPGAYKHFQDMMLCKPRQETLETLREHSISENVTKTKPETGDDANSQNISRPLSQQPRDASATDQQPPVVLENLMADTDYVLRDSLKKPPNRSSQFDLRNTFQSKRNSFFDDFDFTYLRESIGDPRFDTELVDIFRTSMSNNALYFGQGSTRKSEASHTNYEEDAEEEDGGGEVKNVLFQQPTMRKSMIALSSTQKTEKDREKEMDENNSSSGVELHDVEHSRR